MTKQLGKVHIIVDEYTVKLLDTVISRHLANSYGEAVKVAASSILGIPVKSKRELEFEKQMQVVKDVENMPVSINYDIDDKGNRTNERYVFKDGTEKPVKPPEDF